MVFKDFSKTLFEIIDMEPISVSETTKFKEELEIDSLQLVNLVIAVAEQFNIPFEVFIQNTDKIQTVGGLFEIVESVGNYGTT